MSLFKTNNCSIPKRVKTVCKDRKKSEENIIKCIRDLCKLKIENEGNTEQLEILGPFLNNSYVEYGSSNDRNKNLTKAILEEYNN